jgi:hypothetical protein
MAVRTHACSASGRDAVTLYGVPLRLANWKAGPNLKGARLTLSVLPCGEGKPNTKSA